MTLVVTGLGAVCAHGAGVAAFEDAVWAGRCGLATADDADLPLAARLPVGRVTVPLPRLGGRTTSLALLAGREALGGARLPEAALLVGTTTGGMRASEAAYLADPALSAHAYAAQPAHATARLLAARLGLHGPQATHSEACAAAACALGEAQDWLRLGLCEAALVVGSDALTRLTTAGFASLQVVDPAGCRPFTAERAGMNLGEGAAALLLETEAHARARGARPLGRLTGWGLAADAHHATAPHPEGTYLEAALRAALTSAGRSGVDWVHAHGTGTRDNDAVEAATIGRVLGAVPFSGTKRVTGHTMGAAGLFGVVAACRALSRQELPVSAGTELGTPLGAVVRASMPGRIDAAAVTCLAFGGVNAALIVERA